MSLLSSPTSTDATNITASIQNSHEESTNGVDISQVKKRYEEERTKRLREDGLEQYIDVSLSDKFQYFQEDPWVDSTTVKDAQTMFPDNRCQMLILGAGLGGIMYAVRMIEAGFQPDDIRIVDSAGGFGGTWYHNRYPGLMCDIESYCYLPLLEETGYIPKHRYAYSEEIRNYANLIAEKWNITNSAVFQTKAEKLVWDESAKEWKLELIQRRNGEQPQTLKIRSQFVAMVNGVLNWPKLPSIPGILDYQGEVFHSSRWNYSVTGGSPADPSLINLKDKRVAIIGTGATAVQAIPHLARWSKHLYVVQRTPSAVDRRDQRETDPEWFHTKVATSAGWQRKRASNFAQHFTTKKQPTVNLVDDQWTHAAALVPLTGDIAGPRSMEDIPAYIDLLHTIDFPRQNQIRARVDQVVTDQSVAKKLYAWYPTWCKRPCFHDDYLPVFNRDNVTLVDTNGKGLDSLTANSIVVGDQSYPVDIVIFATGYRAPFGGSPAEKGNMTITGRNGISMSTKWAQSGAATLHGVLDHDFPNLFLTGPWQASISTSFVFGIDCLAKQAAYIIMEAKRRVGSLNFAVAPTAAAVEDWASQIVLRSSSMAPVVGCTPGYYNAEGGLERIPPEKRMKMARSGTWGHGFEDFLTHIEAWRAEGYMSGMEVQV